MPAMLVIALVAMLLAMLPVWRLHRAAWRPGVLFAAWVVYTAAMLVVVRAPGLDRFLLPILVLAFVAPFVAGPERLSRVMGARPPKARPVIDVTPRPRPGLPWPPRSATPDEGGEPGGVRGAGDPGDAVDTGNTADPADTDGAGSRGSRT